MTIKELKEEGCKILPYTSVEEAFLQFIDDSRGFESNGTSSIFRNGREDSRTGLKPRELFCLVVAANVANYLSGDRWTVGALVNSDGSVLPGDIAHDGLIMCTDGIKKDQFMWFEQVMATHKSKDASPDDIEKAILKEANKKSSKGSKYGTDEMSLIVFTDYNGRLNDLKSLSAAVQDNAYEVIYLVSSISESAKDYMCAILKSPKDTLGPIRVSFSNIDGSADVGRMLETQY